MQNKSNETISYWWHVPSEKIIETVDSDAINGLSKNKINESRTQFGSNTIQENKPTSITNLIIEGIKEPMMLVLLCVAILSFLFGKIGEAFAMIFVVVAYIVVEFINKYRAERILTRLRALSASTTQVIRDGKKTEITTDDVVVGDILILSEGVLISADARLISSFGLIVNEASLTGESIPVTKNADAILSKDAPLAERINSLFSGTVVLSGEGTAVVTAVGQKTEFGKIAQEVQKAKKEQTLLQVSMTKLAKILAIFAVVISALIPIVGFLRGLNVEEMVLTWLALTFLMIPGQPPIIITMALALAAFELARKQVIVKRLRGAEIMGQVTSIVSDKTGTITENKMKLEKIVLVDGQQKTAENIPHDIQEKIALALPLYSNDPTDKAMRDALTIDDSKISMISLFDFKGFSEKQPWRDLIYKDEKRMVHAISGNPEVIITASLLSDEKRKAIELIMKQEATLGKRVVSYAICENNEDIKRLKNLQFVALAVLHDPVRNGVKEAVNILKGAGVATFIVTGDHSATTQTIVGEIGLSKNVVNGDVLEKISDNELLNLLNNCQVFARITPLQKLRIVTMLQKKGEIVAAIGDGINDALALKAAQVGIAMGQIGTDLIKEVADIVLTDDNYVHIPDAIAIGRKALDNFRKGLTYYLSAKWILLIVFLIPLALGIPFPFSPLQIILIELLMDLASSTIFVTEVAEPDCMKKSAPRLENYLNMALLLKIIQNGTGLACGILFIYLSLYNKTHSLILAQTAAFVTWLLGHILLALNLKQEKMAVMKQGLLSNKFALVWLVGMIFFSIAITSINPLQNYIHTTWLPFAIWIQILIVVICSTFWIELKKVIINRYSMKE